MDTCKRCCKSFPVEEFTTEKGKRSNKCKECRAKAATYMREYYEKNRTKMKVCMLETYRRRMASDSDSIRKYQLLANYRIKYGLSQQDYEQLLDNQEGKCAICRDSLVPYSRFACVDHNHATGFVRGILCPRCNAGIGLLREDRDVMLRAIEYLSEIKGDQKIPT